MRLRSPLSKDDQAVVDAPFDPVHAQSKISWTRKSIQFGYPVVRRMEVPNHLNERVRKCRAVIDIRGLDKRAVEDSYHLSR